MKKKAKNFSGYWYDKTLYLLHLTGYLDKRTNNVKKEEGRVPLNELINDAVVFLLTRGADPSNPNLTVFRNLHKYEIIRIQKQRADLDAKTELLVEKIKRIDSGQYEKEKQEMI